MAEFSDITIDQLVANFELLEDWEARYSYLIDIGRKLPEMAPEHKTEENRVKGCQATVWLKETIKGESPSTVEFTADSNSHIVKGLVAILILLFSKKTSEEILKIDAKSTLAKLELEAHLSPTRKTGLHAMTQQIKQVAQSNL
jgi:cysteine desulfuration protein SufE